MLFMVMSTPRAERPSDMRTRQTSYWDWLEALKQKGIARHVWVKTGRGAFVVFDAPDHETLHRLINEWSDCVPADFQVWPLIDAAHQEAIARAGAKKG